MRWATPFFQLFPHTHPPASSGAGGSPHPRCCLKRRQRDFGSICNCSCVQQASPGTRQDFCSPGRVICSRHGCPGRWGDVIPRGETSATLTSSSSPVINVHTGLKVTGFCYLTCVSLLPFALIRHAARKRSSRLSQPRSPSPAAFQDIHSKNQKAENYRETKRNLPTTQLLPPRPVQPQRTAARRCPIRHRPSPSPAWRPSSAPSPPPQPPRRTGGGPTAGRREGPALCGGDFAL